MSSWHYLSMCLGQFCYDLILVLICNRVMFWFFSFSYACIASLHILYRYARCMTKGWRPCCWNQPKGDVGERIQKMGGPREYMSGKRCSPSEYHLTNTNLVLNPRQASEHSKPPTSLLKYTWVYILYCALSIGVELKLVAACLTLSAIYILVSLLVCIGHSMFSYA